MTGLTERLTTRRPAHRTTNGITTRVINSSSASRSSTSSKLPIKNNASNESCAHHVPLKIIMPILQLIYRSHPQTPSQIITQKSQTSPPRLLPHRHVQRHRRRLVPPRHHTPCLPDLTLAARPAEPASESLVFHQRPRVAVQVRVKILPDCVRGLDFALACFFGALAWVRLEEEEKGDRIGLACVVDAYCTSYFVFTC